MIQYKMVLELFQKVHQLIYPSQFVPDIINYPTFIYPMEPGEFGKKEKIEYLKFMRDSHLIGEKKNNSKQDL